MSFKLAVTILLPLFASFSPSRMETRAAPARFMESDVLDLTKRATQTFNLQISYQSNDFLNWTFFDQPDPTHGLVNYLSKDAAQDKGLVTLNGSSFSMGVGDLVGKNRDSVRISSPETYNGGLFIADFQAMPYGCSLWPAWWSVGPNWPTQGEIDIVEGVNLNQNNQFTLHTSSGCSINVTQQSQMTGKILNVDCTSGGTSNIGCGIQDQSTNSFGEQFNKNGGGIFAHLWQDEGIKAWFFLRGQIPKDITDKQPNPDGWGQPVAFWANTTCNIGQHFSEHSLTLNIALCGDWAGNSFGGSCVGTCEQAVTNDDNFKNAKWVVNEIAVYQLEQ